jgi:FkbM family methyltransferase
MEHLHNRKNLGNIAKSILPMVSAAFMNRVAGQFIRYNELGSCLIQGKGSGAGWDISSEVSVAASLVKTKTPVLLDVGANFGKWSIEMLKLFPGCLKLLLIEPQAECLQALAKIDFAHKVAIPCGVSDQPGEMSFFTAERQAGWAAASLFERHETYFSAVSQRKSVVSIRTLDDIIEEHRLPAVDFMKMDIEGAEILALRGAEASFRARKIKAISFEFGSGNINSRTFFRDFWDFLSRNEFSIHRVLPGGKTLRIKEYYEDLEYFRGVTNYVATL